MRCFFNGAFAVRRRAISFIRQPERGLTCGQTGHGYSAKVTQAATTVAMGS
jgi:hypothetical protein